MTTVQTDIHRDIIEQSKLGNRRSQYELYKLYARPMFSICLRLMNSREEAEDVLQEAFTDAFCELARFRYDSTFGAWIKRIVVNRCINKHKKRKADLTFLEDMSRLDVKEDAPRDDSDLKLTVERIKKVVEELPGGSRIIFSLYMFEGYDHTEIAEILNVSESTSKSQYMRARQLIKDRMIEKYKV